MSESSGRAIAIGDACCLFLAPFPEGFHVLCGVAASRHDFEGPAGACCLLHFKGPRPVITAIPLETLVAQGVLDSEGMGTLLAELVRSPIGRSVLLEDREALDALFRCGVRLAPGFAKATLHSVRGHAECVLVYPKSVDIHEGDVVLGQAGEAVVPAIARRVSRLLAQDAAGLRIAVLEAENTLDGSTLVVLSKDGLSTIGLTHLNHQNVEALCEQTSRKDIDVFEMFLQSSRYLRPALVEHLARANAAANFSDPDWGLHLELDAFHQLPNGYFVSGWFSDPEDRIADLVVVDYRLGDPDLTGHWIVTDETLVRNGARILARRFRAFIPALLSGDPFPPRLRISVRGGRSMQLAAPVVVHETARLRDLILGTIEDRTFSAAHFEKVYAPVLAPLQTALNARQRIRAEFSFGQRSERAVSIIVPLYGQLGFIRPQLMAFMQDAYLRRHCKIIFSLDDPRLVEPVRALLDGYQMWASLDIQLLVLDRNGGFAMANNTAATRAEGEHLVLMNSDVIPLAPGWLEMGLERLATAPDFSVVGPKLLYGDGSLQHAGMYFEKFPHGYFQNLHYWKGYGRDYQPAGEARNVPAVTGACMVLRRVDFDDVGGFTPDYIVGDYEDSDLCLKLRQRGGECIYLASAELYHFERQSMPKIEDAHDRRSTIYNRALHTARWHDDISSLMNGF